MALCKIKFFVQARATIVIVLGAGADPLPPPWPSEKPRRHAGQPDQRGGGHGQGGGTKRQSAGGAAHGSQIHGGAPSPIKNYIIISEGNGGWGGIRTHGRLAPSAVFKTAAIDHSATHPAPSAQASQARAREQRGTFLWWRKHAVISP